MTPEQLSQMCRCGHARRFHRQGTIWEHYSTGCHKHHDQFSLREYSTGCYYFELDVPLVVLKRDKRGRFQTA